MARQSAPRETERVRGNLNVLLVEDDADQREMYKRRLERRGYRVRIVPDGDGAAREVRHSRPDVVVLDIAMPERDGISVLQELLDLDPSLRVVIHTAYPAYADDFAAWAADGFVQKSQDIRPLLRTINEAAYAVRA